MHITLDIDDVTRAELDRKKSQLRQSHPSIKWNRENTAGTLLRSWANAQRAKRATTLSQQPKP